VKILIVDDSLMDRKILMNTLKKNDVANEILEASNGEEGLKILSENFQEICLILLDWQMPVMNGLEFMEGVVKVPAVANIPIVMITASSSEDSKNQAYETNPNLASYVIKPYLPKTLIEIIEPYVKN
jgi:two-component system chemotaxis response regulator CheY